jgi:hypothetical protein
MSSIKYFQKITGYNLDKLLKEFDQFQQVDRNNIINYYSNSSEYVPSKSFSKLKYLQDEFKKVIDLFEINNSIFANSSYWELLSLVEDGLISLNLIETSDKFIRSSKAKVGFYTSSVEEVTQGEFQTIEDIASQRGSTNENDEWQEYAISNRIIEEDYTPDGGLKIDAPRIGSQTLKVEVVADSNLRGTQLYGLDVQKKLEITEDGDLKVLSNEDTVMQSIDIYMNLEKGSNPEFRNDGIDSSSLTGVNVNSLQFPILARQLNEVFSKDDTFVSIQVTNAYFEQDNAFVLFNIVDILQEREVPLSI